MKTARIVGHQSHIYEGIKPMMEADGWTLLEGSKARFGESVPRWNLFISFIGQVAPVGFWHEQNFEEIQECINSNLTTPLRLLHAHWPYREDNATVILFSGSNPQKIMSGYLPYNISKMAIIKAVEQMDHEAPEAKFVAFGPGYVAGSKIHNATLEKNWPNERIARGDAGTPLEEVWKALKFCIESPKELVGGRNIVVSDIPLRLVDESTYKLRRQ